MGRPITMNSNPFTSSLSASASFSGSTSGTALPLPRSSSSLHSASSASNSVGGNADAAAASAQFTAAVNSLFASRLGPVLPGATVYLDDATADCWNTSLPRGGITRFVKNAGAALVTRLDDAALALPSTPAKVFLVALHAGRSLHQITAIVRSSLSRSVHVFSSTPFRVVGEGEAVSDPSQVAPRELIEAELRRAMQQSGAWPSASVPDSEEVLDCHYLPLTWAALLNNVFIVPGSSHTVPSLAAPTGIPLALPTSNPDHTTRSANARQLAVSIFGILQSRDLNAHMWTLGAAADLVAHHLVSIRSFLGVANVPGHSSAAIVLVDRDMDMLPLVASQSHVLSRIYRSSSSRSSATNGTLFSSFHPSAPLTALIPKLPSSYAPSRVPLSTSSGTLAEQWLQLLSDFPAEGLSLLRKKVMDLGGKARVLGRPTAAQFEKLLAALHESEKAKSVVEEHTDCLLLLGLIVEALADENVQLVDKLAGFQQAFESTLVSSAASGSSGTAPLADLLANLSTSLGTNPSVTVRVGLYTVLAALRIAPQCVPSLLDPVAQLVRPALAVSGNAMPTLEVAMRLQTWLESLPPQVPDLVRGVTQAAVTAPDMFTKVDEGGAAANMFGLSRLLVGSPTVPLDCDELILVISGPVAWPEIGAFREVAKECMSKYRKPVTLVATGVEGPIELSVVP
ncbi:hypothetical protein BCR44DRAFT_212836 [Catenaria anguillulae PL171]|uniref:Sec1-like protein n=1 Tax=Catenaria anguillulae PL171 TaxID=765915 RepID=A0A1Y2HK70_9FUNG|nr:hypothetical protein BCR44DRAFT_212836 [Catenaria anguillulae PL171]